MDDNISEMLATLSRVKKYRTIGVRMTEAEFFDLQAYCSQQYLSYSEVIRVALQFYFNSTEKKTN